MARFRLGRAARVVAGIGLVILLVQCLPSYFVDTSFNGSTTESWSSYIPGRKVVPPPRLTYSQDGLVRGWDQVHDKLKDAQLGKKERQDFQDLAAKHPIEDLMQRGTERWEALLSRQSQTLPQAVSEYKRRYGRAPPRGFEQWWERAQENGVKIVDDYDQIFRDIEPFFALSPQMFRKRCDSLKSTGHTYHITLFPTKASSLSGDRASSLRSRLQFQLLEPLAQLLPREVTIHGSDHDLGSWLATDDLRQAAMGAIREGRHLSASKLRALEYENKNQIKGKPVTGIVVACPQGSAAWNRSLALDASGQRDAIPKIEVHETTFMHSPRATYDLCDNPSILSLHGSSSFDVSRESVLRPIFQWSKNILNPEFLSTPLEAFVNLTTPAGRGMHSPWESKTVNKLFWRGRGTGDAYGKRKAYDWRNSHRPRLSLMAQNTEGDSEIWAGRRMGWVKETWSTKKLNEVYMDVGLIGQPHQCDKKDGTCDEMAKEIKFLERVSPQDSAKYKYVFDIDGNGWSSRFHRLIMSGSVVLKATIYPEWMSDWITPWVHYVPVQLDYSDVYSILSFFIGPPDAPTSGRDDLAQKISEQARQFAEEHWRWEDMQSYMHRLLLEYIRLQVDDRDDWVYQG